MFLFVFSILSRRCPLLATFLSVLFCLLSLLTSDSRFDLVWFRLSCDHGWIPSGSVNVRKTTTTTTTTDRKQPLCVQGRISLFVRCHDLLRRYLMLGSDSKTLSVCEAIFLLPNRVCIRTFDIVVVVIINGLSQGCFLSHSDY